MSKKIIIGIVIGIVVLGIFGQITVYSLTKSKSEKAYNFLEKGYCETDHCWESTGEALTEWKCEQCGIRLNNPNTNTLKLCGNCARTTVTCHQHQCRRR